MKRTAVAASLRRGAGVVRLLGPERRLSAVATVALALLALAIQSASAYGPVGHEIVGAVADRKLAGTPTAAKLNALIPGLTLERAATIPDEIKAWDKKGAGDPNAWPHFPQWPQLEQQLREFWKANPPGPDANDEHPSHHWFHYTDVPLEPPQKYADGKAGRSKWDVVHVIPYCIGVLRGEIPEDNPRKITKPVAVVLLAHFVGDIHQPLHVGAEYFSPSGQPDDPDRDPAALSDEGGNSLSLVENASATYPRHFYHALHGYWDSDAVRNLVIGTPDELPKAQRDAVYNPAKEKLIADFVAKEPRKWTTPGNAKTWAEQWADEILPIAREAHTRLHFEHVHRDEKNGHTFAAGEAMENGTGYRNWASQVVGDELHKAGWRLAALLQQSLASQSTAPAPSAAASPATAAPSGTPSASISPYGVYPADYKKLVADWLSARDPHFNPNAIDWQGEPKPATLPDADAREVAGYLVIFNSPDRGNARRSRGVLIHDGKIVVANGFP